MFIINANGRDVMNRVCTVLFIDDFVFIIGVVVGMDVHYADVVVQCGCFGVSLYEQSEHRVVAMGIPSREEDDMFPVVVHYRISIISASGKSDSLKVKKSAGNFWLVTNFLIT